MQLIGEYPSSGADKDATNSFHLNRSHFYWQGKAGKHEVGDQRVLKFAKDLVPHFLVS